MGGTRTERGWFPPAASALLLPVVASLVVTARGYLGDEVEPYRPPPYYPPPHVPAGAEVVGVGRQLYLRDCRSVMVGTGGGRHGAQRRDERSCLDRLQAPHRPDADRRSEDETTRGELSTGQQLYQQHCGTCHGTTAIGGAMLSQRGRETLGGTTGIIIPGIEWATAPEIAEATRTGPGTIPAFGPSVISDAGFDSLVFCTLYLKDPRDVGGASLGHIGPVIEGAVGWLVGLGVLLIVIRWIGTAAGEQR